MSLVSAIFFSMALLGSSLLPAPLLPSEAMKEALWLVCIFERESLLAFLALALLETGPHLAGASLRLPLLDAKGESFGLLGDAGLSRGDLGESIYDALIIPEAQFEILQWVPASYWP